MRLITTGPPKSGTTALKRIAVHLGFKPLPGALIYGEWKRYPRWIETTRRSVPKHIVKENIVRLPPDRAYEALKDGMFLHGHIPPPTPPTIHTLVLLRDPKSAMVSWYRAKMLSKTGQKIDTPDDRVREQFAKWLKKGGQRAADYIQPIHEGWRREPPRGTLLIVHYETLFTEPTLQLIAEFTGRPAPRVEDIYGWGSKYSGLPTVSADWYTPLALERFQERWGQARVQPVGSEERGADFRSYGGG